MFCICVIFSWVFFWPQTCGMFFFQATLWIVTDIRDLGIFRVCSWCHCQLAPKTGLQTRSQCCPTCLCSSTCVCCYLGRSCFLYSPSPPNVISRGWVQAACAMVHVIWGDTLLPYREAQQRLLHSWMTGTKAILTPTGTAQPTAISWFCCNRLMSLLQVHLCLAVHSVWSCQQADSAAVAQYVTACYPAYYPASRCMLPTTLPHVSQRVTTRCPACYSAIHCTFFQQFIVHRSACYPTLRCTLPSTLPHGVCSSVRILCTNSGFCSEEWRLCHLDVVYQAWLLVADPVHWVVIAKEPFVEASRSPPLWRALYIPVLSAQHVHWTHYVLLSSKTLVDRTRTWTQRAFNLHDKFHSWMQIMHLQQALYSKTCTMLAIKWGANKHTWLYAARVMLCTMQAVSVLRMTSSVYMQRLAHIWPSWSELSLLHLSLSIRSTVSSQYSHTIPTNTLSHTTQHPKWNPQKS